MLSIVLGHPSEVLRMYYDEEARRFNFLSGLLCGSVLGAGLALLVAPQKGVRIRRLVRRSGG